MSITEGKEVGPVLVKASYRTGPLIWYIAGLLRWCILYIQSRPLFALGLSGNPIVGKSVIFIFQCQWISTRRAGMLFYHVCGLLGRLLH